MDERFRQLIELGAGEFEHANSLLIAHLEGTRCLLKAWNASDVVQDAGLYLAAYVTSNFEKKIFELSHRKEVADVIGNDAENIIYHYCACAVFLMVTFTPILYIDERDSKKYFLGQQKIYRLLKEQK